MSSRNRNAKSSTSSRTSRMRWRMRSRTQERVGQFSCSGSQPHRLVDAGKVEIPQKFAAHKTLSESTVSHLLRSAVHRRGRAGRVGGCVLTHGGVQSVGPWAGASRAVELLRILAIPSCGGRQGQNTPTVRSAQNPVRKYSVSPASLGSSILGSSPCPRRFAVQ